MPTGNTKIPTGTISPEIARQQAEAMQAENPKDKFGDKKPPVDAIPPVAILELGQGMNDGKKKYGRMNYRDHKTISSVYYNAAMRHLLSWWDGEDSAEDSGVHHLGHVTACCAIILDGIHQGNLEDDRPKPGPFSKRVSELSRATANELSEESDAAKVLRLYKEAGEVYPGGPQAFHHRVKEWLRDNAPSTPGLGNYAQCVFMAAQNGPEFEALIAWLESVIREFGHRPLSPEAFQFPPHRAEEAEKFRTKLVQSAYQKALEHLLSKADGTTRDGFDAKVMEWILVHGFTGKKQFLSAKDALTYIAMSDMRAYMLALDWLRSFYRPEEG